MTIKAVLFDSGRVLNRPATGHWFIPPGFFECVDRNIYAALDKRRINKAFRNAGQYVDAQPLIQTKDEELLHFREFYRIFAECLPELGLTEENVSFLAFDLVFNAEKYTFYEDALQTISALQGKYKLAVISDAWPSLTDVFIKNGLYNSFDSFVISSILGITKPDQKMYLTALEELCVLPEEAVFVDDNLCNCQGALKLGIRPILLCRNKWQYCMQKIRAVGKGYMVLNSLAPLLSCLGD